MGWWWCPIRGGSIMGWHGLLQPEWEGWVCVCEWVRENNIMGWHNSQCMWQGRLLWDGSVPTAVASLWNIMGCGRQREGEREEGKNYYGMSAQTESLQPEPCFLAVPVGTFSELLPGSLSFRGLVLSRSLWCPFIAAACPLHHRAPLSYSLPLFFSSHNQ